MNLSGRSTHFPLDSKIAPCIIYVNIKAYQSVLAIEAVCKIK